MTPPHQHSSPVRSRRRDRIRRATAIASLVGLLALTLIVVPSTANAAGKHHNPFKSIKKATHSAAHSVAKKYRTDRLWRWTKHPRWKPAKPAPKPKPTPKPTATATPKPTVTTSPTAAPKPTATTATPTPTATTATPKPTATTATPTPTATTATPKPTATTATPTPTATTATPKPTATTATPTPTATTATPKPTATTSSPTPTPTQTSSTPAGPSGLALPKGDLPGWKQHFADDFNRSTPGSNWGSYSGQPGGNPAGWWMPSHTYTSDGKLILDNYFDGGKNASGGTSAWSASKLTYGKYEVRFRADVGKGYGYVFLLWPSSGVWPNDGEIDFAEDGGSDRQSTSATLHYGANNSQIQRHLNADFTKWHTIGVEWTPGKLVYTLDGKPWGTPVTGSMVPTKPMFLALQSAALPCSQWSQCVDSSTPAHTKIEIDWVNVYSYAPTTATSTPSSAGLLVLPFAGLAAVSPLLVRTRRPNRRRVTK